MSCFRSVVRKRNKGLKLCGTEFHTSAFLGVFAYLFDILILFCYPLNTSLQNTLLFPSIIILKTHNIIFPKIAAILNLNQL